MGEYAIIGNAVHVPTYPPGEITLEWSTKSIVKVHRFFYDALDSGEVSRTMFLPATALQQVLDMKTKRTEEPMPNDTLDKPITVRMLKEAFEAANPVFGGRTNTFARTLDNLMAKSTLTDFIVVNFGNQARRYIYKISSQPQRRVQVGDLVAVASNAFNGLQVARVTEVNVPQPKTGVSAAAVAISPEDAKIIERTFGSVR